jgi:hypothetical protein
MARLIDPVPRGGGLLSGEHTREKAQAYGERVAKYVPAEIIAAYLALLSIILSNTQANTDRRTIWLTVIFGVGTVLTPIYLWRFPGDVIIKRYHLVLSTAAFVIWVYSIRGGMFDDLGLYEPIAAPALLVIFTLVSGLIAPTARGAT